MVFMRINRNPRRTGGTVQPKSPFGSEGVTVSVLVETVGTTTRMGVFHEVTSRSVGGFLRGDLPVTVSLNHRANVADRGTKVRNAEPGTSLCGRESLAAREVVDDAALLGKSVVHINESPFGCLFRSESRNRTHVFLNSMYEL